jgi:magnesium chelatase subunit D
MTEADTTAAVALALLAVDPAGLGGVLIRSPAGPGRDAWLEAAREALCDSPDASDGTDERPWRRVPLSIGEQRLTGGIDLVATLAAGRPVAERGLLARADGGVLVLASAERVAGLTAARIGMALDTGRCGDDPARFAVIALDEGADADERCPPGLADRLAFHLHEGDVLRCGVMTDWPDPDAVRGARGRLANVVVPDEIVAGITATAAGLGIDSLRAPILALRVARASAALAGRAEVERGDAELAVRLVLAPRATRLPMPDSDPAPDEPPPPPEPDPQQSEPQTSDDDEARDDPDRPLDDLLIDAAKAAIPPGLLALLAAGAAPPARQPSAGRVGAERRSLRHGRPAGTRAGDPRRGGRLDVVATLRAAAPWQAIRRAGRPAKSDAAATRLVEVRRADLRLRRYQQRTGTVLIFAVDASGSAALARLAEAKGAVELLLADCYVRRDEVAVLAFRGMTADLLLPPTRSLVRAKRALADLPGGGATPLAGALDAARELGLATRRKGRQAAIVLLTDGRGNVARDGRQGRAVGEADALAAATAVRAAGIATLLIDTSPRAQPQAARLAEALAARYVPLPHADARRLSGVVRASLDVDG